MKVFRYWARADVDEQGEPVSPADHRAVTGAAGWSDQQQEAAEANALERARRFAALIRDGALDRLLSRYGYLDRPVREPIVEEVTDGELRIAAITRNAYGAYVLNSAHVLFADIDRDRRLGPAVRNIWAHLRGRKSATPEQKLLEKLAEVSDAHRVSFRVYRTRGGHRAMVVDRTFDPGSEASQALLDACGSDPLYRQLCRGQQCYRARLSPKPWRIGMGRGPNVKFPYRTDAEREAFEVWIARYEQATQDWATAELVAELGEGAVHPEVAPVLTLHDDLACAPGRPLA